MIAQQILDVPEQYQQLQQQAELIGFDMPSDMLIGSLLKTLIATKPQARVLELGTGIGLSLSWMLAGLDGGSEIISIDNDPELIRIAKENFKTNTKLKLFCEDAASWITKYKGPQFDLVFADAWPGKYSELDALLAHIKIGGLYVIDDMLPQSNWPTGHDKKATALVAELEQREDLVLTKMNWSTGIIVATKIEVV